MRKILSISLICAIIICSVSAISVYANASHEIKGAETVINAQGYYSSEGSISSVSDYWLDNGKSYITNGENAYWSASYKITVSNANVGLYDLFAVCNHWSPNQIGLKVSLDGTEVSTVNCSNVTVLGQEIPRTEVGNIHLTSGEHVIKVEGTAGSLGYYFRELAVEQINTELSDNLIIPAVNYFSSEGELMTDDYWLDTGNTYLVNKNSEYWSASYRISVSDKNEGIYSLSTVCNHWSPNEIGLRVSLDGDVISTVRCTNVTSPGETIPDIDVGKVVFKTGMHTIKVEGVSDSNGYYLKRLTLNKIDSGIAVPTLGISAKLSEAEEGKAVVELTKHCGNVNSAVLVAAVTNNGVLKETKISDSVSLVKDENVRLELDGIDTNLVYGDVCALYCMESFQSLMPITYKTIYNLYAADKPYLFESAAEPRALDSDLNEAYKYIVEDGFKGVYCTQEQYAQTETIQALKDAGVNTFIVFIYHATTTAEDAFKNVISEWKKAVGDAKLITVISFGGDQAYGNTKFGEFVDKNGKKINAPCPLSKKYWDKVYGERAKWSYEMGVSGCMVDMEMYGANETHFTADRKCHCDDCWSSFCDYAFSSNDFGMKTAEERNAFLNNFNIYEEYKNYQSNKLEEILGSIRSSLPESFMLGYLIYFQELGGIEKGLGTATAPALVFDEYTYFMHDNNNSYVYNILGNIYGNNDSKLAKPVVFLPGFWPQKYSASEQETVIENIMKTNHKGKYSDGYWIWCMSSFMHSESEDGYAGSGCMSGEAPAEYIKTLKNIAAKTNK